MAKRIPRVVALPRRGEGSQLGPVVLSRIEPLRYRAEKLLEEIRELYPAAVLIDVPGAVYEAATASEVSGWEYSQETVWCRRKREEQPFGHHKWHFWDEAAERSEVTAWLARYPVVNP